MVSFKGMNVKSAVSFCFGQMCVWSLPLACGVVLSLPLRAHTMQQESELSQTDLVTDANTSRMQLIGKLRPSFYWIALETNDGKPKDQKLLDVDGNLLATVSATYLKKLNMEGTGQLLDGRIINFKARLTHPDGSKEIRWRICDPKVAPYGYGYADIPLNAFRSTAVDPKVIPLGSQIYIPAAVGAVLPDGSVHDGFFTAVDIGDLIQDKKIDIFTSFGDQSKVFESMGLETGKITDIYLVK